MSYDVEIGTREAPTRELVESWAAEKGLVVESDSDPAHLVIIEDAASGPKHLFEVGGPHAAEPEDFTEEIVAACLAPRWMTQILVPYSVPKRAISLGRSLARHLAEAGAGAAFDPQTEGLIWPRGRPKRVPARESEEDTSIVRLDWFLPANAGQEAPAKLVELLKRMCPEALPTRYGQYEPPPFKFDPADPGEFVRFLQDNDDGNAFWFARRPSFGGRFTAPRAAKRTPPEAEHLSITHMSVDFDNNVLVADSAWREAVIDLFTAGAKSMGAFYAAIQLDPGWKVSKNNQLSISAVDLMKDRAEHIRCGMLWQGLPPVPVWVSWYASPYLELLSPALFERSDAVQATTRPRRLMHRLLQRSNGDDVQPEIRDHGDGFTVRLGEHGAIAANLPPLPIPEQLTYRHRPPTDHPGGGVMFDTAKSDDAAEVIPPING